MYRIGDTTLRTVGYMFARKRKERGHFGLCKHSVASILERAATYAKALWLSIANVQVIVWLDNFNKQRYGPNNLNPDKSLDSTALAILHTTELPHFRGQPIFSDLVERVPDVAADLAAELCAINCRGLSCGFHLILSEGTCRVYLMWRPFMLSPLIIMYGKIMYGHSHRRSEV